MTTPSASSVRPLPVLLTGTMILQVLATANTLVVPVLTPTIPGATIVGVGWYMTVLYIGAMFSAVWSGNVINRIGPMRTSQLALVLQLLGLALALLGSAEWRLLGALLCGLGYGPVTPASSLILSRHTPPEHVGLVFSIKQTGVPVGGLLTGLLLIPIASASSWQIAVLAMIALGVLGVLLGQLLQGYVGLAREASVNQPRQAPWYRALLSILRERDMREDAALSMCFSMVQLTLSGYLVLYLNQEVGLSLVQAGIVFGVSQAAGVLGRLGWGRLGDVTQAPEKVLMLLALLMAVSTLVVGFVRIDWPIVLIAMVCALFGATALGWNGLFLGEVARKAPPGMVASTTGAVLFYTYVGVVVGPLMFAQFSELMGSLGLSFMALTLIPMLAAGILWQQRQRRLAAS